MAQKLTQLKITAKDLLVADLIDALLFLKSQLRPNCEAYDEVIIAHERSNRINKALQKSLISFNEADLLLNQIVNSVVFTINNLKESDLAVEPPKQ
jgi:hypothetical protein